MLRNLSVRSKLVAVVAVPLLACTAMAAIGVRDRLDQADRAREQGALAQLTSARIDLAQQVQGERLWTAVVLSSNGLNGTQELAAQRPLTSAALARFTERVQAGAVGSADVQRAADTARRKARPPPTTSPC